MAPRFVYVAADTIFFSFWSLYTIEFYVNMVLLMHFMWIKLARGWEIAWARELAYSGQSLLLEGLSLVPNSQVKKIAECCGTCLYFQSCGVETRWWGSGHSDWPSGLAYSVSAKPASSKVDKSWGMVPCVHTHLPVGVHPCEHTETQLTVSGLFPEEESLCQLLAPSSSSCFSTLCSLASVLCLTLFFSEGTFGANLALDLSVFPFLFICKTPRAFTVPLLSSLASLR